MTYYSNILKVSSQRNAYNKSCSPTSLFFFSLVCNNPNYSNNNSANVKGSWTSKEPGSNIISTIF
jgi:hypothetical protein